MNHPLPPTPPRPSLSHLPSSASTTGSDDGAYSPSSPDSSAPESYFPGSRTHSRGGTTTRGTTPRTGPSSAKFASMSGPVSDASESSAGGAGISPLATSASASTTSKRSRRREAGSASTSTTAAGSGLGKSRRASDAASYPTDRTIASTGALGMTTVPGPGAGPTHGASRMAIAAAERFKGKGKAVEPVDEDHPLSETSLASRGYHSFLCFNHPFHLESRWSLQREMGQGAYGLVVAASDALSGETIAIKMITRVFDKLILARRCLREITLLRHLNGHENITGLIDLDTVTDEFNEVYLFMEPMEADLHQIIRSGQQLSNSHIQYFLYQLLRGLKYIHSANVIHRDLKPGNILVNADCELKICDLGLARGFQPDPSEWDPNSMGPGGPLTEYVATRWYRAPEVMLSYKRYSTAIDVWSTGCILAELIGGKPLFKGKDYIEQLNLILQAVGTPNDAVLDRIGSEKACAYIRTLPVHPKRSFADIFPDTDPDAIDLLERMLAFDPADRITVAEALRHPYMAPYHDATDEPDCPAIFDKWETVEGLTTIPEFKAAIKREVDEFRREVRAVDEWEPESQEEMLSRRGSKDLDSPASGRETSLPTVQEGSPLREGSQSGSGKPSPAMPTSALSEESFGDKLRSRRLSSMSHHSGDPFVRRPNAGLVGNTPIMGMTPLPGSDVVSQTLPRGHASRPSFSGSEYGSYRGPKSRQASHSGPNDGFRPLVRGLSSLSVKDLVAVGRHPAHDPPPMSVSPSDAPPSEAPLEFRPNLLRRTSSAKELSRRPESGAE